jgi:hypothetical protein
MLSAGVGDCGHDIDVVHYCRFCVGAADGARALWMVSCRFVDDVLLCGRRIGVVTAAFTSTVADVCVPSFGHASSIPRIVVACQSLIVSPPLATARARRAHPRSVPVLSCVPAAVSIRCRAPPPHLSPSIFHLTYLSCISLALPPSLHWCHRAVAAAVCVADAEMYRYTWSMLPREL